MKTVFDVHQIESPSSIALGCFDGIHPGHRAVLEQALAGKRDGLSPGVFTFGTPERMLPPVKHADELMSLRMKQNMLETMGFDWLTVAAFEPLRNLSPEEFVRDILRNVLNAKRVCCGFNYRFGKNGIGDATLLRSLGETYGIEVCVSDAVEIAGAPVSSTRIRQAIAAGDMEQAEMLLGQPFTIDFVVVHGRQLGRKLGTPTINQEFPAQFVLPRFGVYASCATVDGVRYPAVTNAGMKPTVLAERPLAETFLDGFSGDLYGKNVEVEFLQFMRPEQKFDSIAELQKQILLDAKRAGEILNARESAEKNKNIL